MGALASVIPASAAAASRPARIGVVMGVAKDAEGETRSRAFRQGLQELGWRVGDNVHIEERWAGGDLGRAQAFAQEIVAAAPDVFVATATPIAVAVRDQTGTIPIIFINLVDPIGAGIVKTLAQPGGNMTGLTNIEPAMGGKWLELLKEMAPGLTRAGFLFNPNASPYAGHRAALGLAGERLGVAIADLAVADESAIDRAVATFAGAGPGGLVVMTDLFTSGHHRQIVAAAARHKVPAMFPYRFFVASGGLMSYSADVADLYRRAASYADRILRGVKPADLPVQTPSKFEMVINLRTAANLGLQVPPAVAARADELIE